MSIAHRAGFPESPSCSFPSIEPQSGEAVLSLEEFRRRTADEAFSRAAGVPLIPGNRIELLLDACENYPAWKKTAERHRGFENSKGLRPRTVKRRLKQAEILAAEALTLKTTTMERCQHPVESQYTEEHDQSLCEWTREWVRTFYCGVCGKRLGDDS